jgi:hypothetical protein
VPTPVLDEATSPSTVTEYDVVGRFADPDGTPFTVGAGRLVLVAERR